MGCYPVHSGAPVARGLDQPLRDIGTLSGTSRDARRQGSRLRCHSSLAQRRPEAVVREWAQGAALLEDRGQ